MRATLEDAVSGVNFQVGPGRTEMFTLSVFTGKFSGSSESDIRLVVTSPNGTVFLPKKVVRETLGFESATGQDCTSFSYANPPISSGMNESPLLFCLGQI